MDVKFLHFTVYINYNSWIFNCKIESTQCLLLCKYKVKKTILFRFERQTQRHHINLALECDQKEQGENVIGNRNLLANRKLHGINCSGIKCRPATHWQDCHVRNVWKLCSITHYLISMLSVFIFQIFRFELNGKIIRVWVVFHEQTLENTLILKLNISAGSSWFTYVWLNSFGIQIILYAVQFLFNVHW